MNLVKIIVISGKWDRNVLLPMLAGQLNFPKGIIVAPASAAEAATRVANLLGLNIPADTWVTVAATAEDNPDEVLLTVRVANDALYDLASLADRKLWSQTELVLCDAWLNASRFEPGIMGLLERAHQALEKKSW